MASEGEARRLKKQVAQLERREEVRRGRWAHEWPNGVQVSSCSFGANHEVAVVVRVARKLGHYVIVTVDDAGVVRFIAEKWDRATS